MLSADRAFDISTLHCTNKVLKTLILGFLINCSLFYNLRNKHGTPSLNQPLGSSSILIHKPQSLALSLNNKPSAVSLCLSLKP